VLVELTSTHLAAYRKAHRGDRWRAVSIELRVTMNRCEVCDLRPREMYVLEAAHLVSEFEMFALGLRERFLFDRRGLSVLCSSCHTAFDLIVCGVRDPSRMTRLQAARARGRHRRFAREFRQLGVRRIRWAATMFREADGEPTPSMASA
jgi:hypothetical protein